MLQRCSTHRQPCLSFAVSLEKGPQSSSSHSVAVTSSLEYPRHAPDSMTSMRDVSAGSPLPERLRHPEPSWQCIPCEDAIPSSFRLMPDSVVSKEASPRSAAHLCHFASICITGQRADQPPTSVQAVQAQRMRAGFSYASSSRERTKASAVSFYRSPPCRLPPLRRSRP